MPGSDQHGQPVQLRHGDRQGHPLGRHLLLLRPAEPDPSADPGSDPESDADAECGTRDVGTDTVADARADYSADSGSDPSSDSVADTGWTNTIAHTIADSGADNLSH